MKKIFAILAITVVAMTVCFSSISFSAASRKSPVATITRPRNTNNNPSNPTGNPGGGDDHSNGNASTVNPEDDSSEWFRTSTTNPNNGGDNGNPGGGNGTDGTNGTGDSTTSPVTGDYVAYSVLIAAGLGLSSLFAYKKYTSKKK